MIVLRLNLLANLMVATQKLLFIMLDQRDPNDTLTVNCFTSVIGPKSSNMATSYQCQLSMCK